MQKILLLASFAGLLLFPGLYAQETPTANSENHPEIFGLLKTKVEFDLNHSLMRFEVRNARFGVKGKINQYFSYKTEIDLSDEGQIKMLDAYVLFSPIANLYLYMGQRKIPFSTDYMRNPADELFANRSFIAKYINDGLRDIGFYANYKFTSEIPADIFLGAVNGTGNNNPKWIDKPNFAGRLIVGPEKGVRIAGNLYYGDMHWESHLAMFGEEIRYSRGSFFIESEYVRRNWTDTLATRIHDDGLYIHSYYNFTLKNKMIRLLTPAARWDFMGNAVFKNDIAANRLTLGLNTGFEPKQFIAEIRLNYEKYFKRSLPIHTDKFTVEFIAQF